ncbi:hypothetical protein ACF0H5_002490 [Mactra antiquata]
MLNMIMVYTCSEPSLSEKQAYADSLVKLKEAEKYLGQAYCVLVLGLGLEDEHHMICGMSRVSATDKDRAMFETLYSYCTFVVWIAFRRKDFEAVKKEVGRMLRSDTFNPAIRVKNAPEEKDPDKKEEKTDGKKEVKIEKKITPAEYRRLHPKRPAIKSIIYQRSPAIVAILPSPKEEAHWLFKTRRPLSPNSLGKIGHEEEDEKNSTDKSCFIIEKRNFKIGIIGDPLSQYTNTLSPLGADNEDEENEGEDGEQKQSNDDNNDDNKKPNNDENDKAEG